MTEMSELRERVSNLEVDVAVLREQNEGIKASIDSLTGQLKPVIETIMKAKAYLAGGAIAAALVGSSFRDAAEWVTKFFTRGS